MKLSYTLIIGTFLKKKCFEERRDIPSGGEDYMGRLTFTEPIIVDEKTDI